MKKFSLMGLGVISLATAVACGTELPTGPSTEMVPTTQIASVVSPSGTKFCSGTTAAVGGWFSIPQNPNWVAPLAGSTWIGPTAGSSVDAPRSITQFYSTTFELPAFTTASISGLASFDNDLAIKVNGGANFFDTGLSDNPAHFQGGNEAFGTTAGFVTGVNTVTFGLNNDASPGASVDPTGLNFCFTITYEVPPPPPPPPPPPVEVAYFVIGDVPNPIVGSNVFFWGAQWWKNNKLSGFTAKGVASEKGFVVWVTGPIACGETWHSKPGNSGHPPDEIPNPIGIIVTSNVYKDGNDLSGNIKKLVTVNHDGKYGPNPGHEAKGVITSVNCTAN